MMNDWFSMNFMMNWDWDGDGDWQGKELGLQEFSNESSFHEFSDHSSLSSLSRDHEEGSCQESSEEDGQDSHFRFLLVLDDDEKSKKF